MATFPEWTVIPLNYPLRTSKRLAEIIKNSGQHRFTYLLGNSFNHLLQVSANMPVGPERIVVTRSEGRTYIERIQKGFDHLGVKNPEALFIVSMGGMSPTDEEVQIATKTSLGTNL